MVKVKTIFVATTFIFDVEKYKVQIDAYIVPEQKEAIRAWLKNVLARTPTYTGTARGTYVGVGRIVGRRVNNLGPKGRGKSKKFFKFRGKKYPTGFSKGKNYSSEKIHTPRKSGNKRIYTFTFDQRLPYVLWNEISPAGSFAGDPIPSSPGLPSNPPWGALKSALNAYSRYVNGKLFRGFPKVIDSMGRIRIRTR